MANLQSVGMTPGYGTPSEERLLLDHLRRMDLGEFNNYAIHVHLSDLGTNNRKPQFIRVAARSFENLVAVHEAALYTLANADLVLVCKNVPEHVIEGGIFKLRALFSEDPLAGSMGDADDDRFVTWYDLSLESDRNAILSVADVNASRVARERQASTPASSQENMTGIPLNPKNLAAIDQKLQETRIEDLIQCQPAIQIKGKGEFLFEEHYVSMAGLQKRIAPNINLFACTWLFQYLTQTLDVRMLAVLAQRNFADLEGAVSLNLNIGTILSDHFKSFHDAVGQHADKIIIELQLINVFSDMGAFVFVRDSLQSRGYRVLIDGLSPLSLQFFDPALLKADFIKINWAPQFLGEVARDRLSEMREDMSHIGADRVILARVDSEDAIKWGLNLGVTRFQGHFVDRIAAAMSAKGDL